MNFKERMEVEREQLQTRLRGLDKYIESDFSTGEQGFKPNKAYKESLVIQAHCMRMYLGELNYQLASLESEGF